MKRCAALLSDALLVEPCCKHTSQRGEVDHESALLPSTLVLRTPRCTRAACICGSAHSEDSKGSKTSFVLCVNWGKGEERGRTETNCGRLQKSEAAKMFHVVNSYPHFLDIEHWHLPISKITQFPMLYVFLGSSHPHFKSWNSSESFRKSTVKNQQAITRNLWFKKGGLTIVFSSCVFLSCCRNRVFLFIQT